MSIIESTHVGKLIITESNDKVTITGSLDEDVNYAGIATLRKHYPDSNYYIETRIVQTLRPMIVYGFPSFSLSTAAEHNIDTTEAIYNFYSDGSRLFMGARCMLLLMNKWKPVEDNDIVGIGFISSTGEIFITRNGIVSGILGVYVGTSPLYPQFGAFDEPKIELNLNKSEYLCNVDTISLPIAPYISSLVEADRWSLDFAVLEMTSSVPQERQEYVMKQFEEAAMAIRTKFQFQCVYVIKDKITPMQLSLLLDKDTGRWPELELGETPLMLSAYRNGKQIIMDEYVLVTSDAIIQFILSIPPVVIEGVQEEGVQEEEVQEEEVQNKVQEGVQEEAKEEVKEEVKEEDAKEEDEEDLR